MSAPTPAPGDDRPREGYYPDPSIPGYVRYWNGAAWVPGTSRPAPSDGEPLSPPPGTRPVPAAAVEETGPHFFDEDPVDERGPVEAQHGSRPEPASAWGADRTHQAGFGGDQDRRVSWGAPPAADPRIPHATDPTDSDPASAEGTFVFRRPGGQPGGGASAAEGESGPATPGIPGPAGPADDGTMTFRPVPTGAHGAGQGGATPGGQGVFGPAGGPGTADGSGAAAGTTASGKGSSGPGFAAGKAAAARAAAAQAQGPVQAGQAAAQAQPQGPVQRGPAPAQAPVQAQVPGPAVPPAAAPSAAAPTANPSTPDASAGLPGSSTGSAGPSGQTPASAGLLGSYPAPAGLPGPSAASAPSAPLQPGAPQPASGPAPMTTGSGGGQSSWAQQVHQLAGAGEEQSVTPWKPPVEDPFQAAARRQAAARPAGLGKRLAARLVDTVVLAGVTAVAAVPLGTRAVDHVDAKIDAAKLSGRTVTVWLLDGTTGTYLGIVLGVLLLAGLLYEVLPTARWGRTLGKKLCGLQVRDIEAHEPPGFGAALRRWLVYSIPGLLGIGLVGVLWCLFDRPWHQCWHDKAAHTFVAG